MAPWRGLFRETRRAWPGMTFYERFEQAVALVFMGIIAVVVAAALFQLVADVFRLVVQGTFNPLTHQSFQLVFGGMMTLLIAMEFGHSILRVGARRGSVIQVRTVILVALLALTRKFIVLDIGATVPATVGGLAAATVALGVVYWLILDGDARLARRREAAQGGEAPPRAQPGEHRAEGERGEGPPAGRGSPPESGAEKG